MPMKSAEEWELEAKIRVRQGGPDGGMGVALHFDNYSNAAEWIRAIQANAARAQRESDWSAHGRGQCRERIRNNPLVTDAASPKPRGGE